MGNILATAIIFALAYFKDDGTCQKYITQDICLSPKTFEGSPMCVWNANKDYCDFADTDKGKRIGFMNINESST